MIKNKVKLIVDSLMTICFVALMCNQMLGLFALEILGITVIVLFLIHQILNIDYYRNIFKGKYNKIRIAYLIIDLLLLIAMLVMILSSILISQYTLKFLNLRNNYIGRKLHIVSVYSIYMLIGLHIGFHYNMIFKLKGKTKWIFNSILAVIALTIGIVGINKREIIQKLTLKSLFPMHSEEGILLTILEYIGILLLFTMIGYGIFSFMNLKKKKEKKDE